MIAGGPFRKGESLLPELFEAPSWSPDGSLIAFTGRIPSSSRPTAIYILSADGSGLREVPGTAEGRDPVFAPDGRTIACAGR